jgi:thermitase
VGGREVRSYPQGPSLVQLAPGVDRAGALRRLGSSPIVLYAEPNGTVQAESIIPNDPLFDRQWGLNNANDVDVDAPEAWQVTTGNPTTIVAVIDTGIDLTHPDLAGRIWTNPGEVGGNGRDDDRNGYVDDVHGWNFITDTSDVTDQNGHGTHVAGILGAAGNNATGGAGVNWNARIMPLKFMGALGDGSIDDAVRAIYYAVNEGARVINASWGSSTYSQSLVDAISFAGAHNVVFVTAAGNEDANNDVTPSYPANIRLPNVISVAAVDASGNLGQFSNYGATTVDIAAPGIAIRSTIPGGGYANYSGTSMASPFVAGVASLLVGLHPDWTAKQVVQQVLATAKPLPMLAGKAITGGIVSAARAVGMSGSMADQTALQVRAQILASDGYYAVQGAKPARLVAAVYRDVLGRAPTRAESNRWLTLLRKGHSRLELAASLLTTPAAKQQDAIRLYQTDLHRATPASKLKTDPGVNFVANLLVAGQNPDDVRAQLLASDVFAASAGPTNDTFVLGLYADIFGRAPTPTEWFSGSLQLAQGTSRRDLALSLMQTVEARQTQVALYFQQYLHRPQPLAVLKLDPLVVAMAATL